MVEPCRLFFQVFGRLMRIGLNLELVKNSLMDSATLSKVSITVSLLLGVMAVYLEDWFWILPPVLNVVLLVLTLHDGVSLSNALLIWSIIPAIVQMVFMAVNTWATPLDYPILNVPIYSYLSASMQAMQSFIVGLMTLLYLDNREFMCISVRWMVLLAMMFSLAVSVMCMFYTFVALYGTDYPLFNEEVSASGNRISNNFLMVPSFTAVIVSAVYAMVTVKKIDKDKSVLIWGAGQ